MATASTLPGAVRRPGGRVSGPIAAWFIAHQRELGLAVVLSTLAAIIHWTSALDVLGRDKLSVEFLFKIFFEEATVFTLLVLALARAQRLAVRGWRRHLLTAVISLGVALVANGPWYVLEWPWAAAGVSHGVTASVGALLLYNLWQAMVLGLLAQAYIERSTEERTVAGRLRRVRLEQVAARRRLVEGRLASIQARVDPQFFFDALDAVQSAYATDPPRAEALLEELIQFLRAALPRLKTSASTIAQECDLARSYVLLRALAHSAEASLETEVSNKAATVSFPPGVLLPLVEGVLRVAPSQPALRLAADAAPSRASLRLAATVRPDAAAVARVRAVLAEVYGGAAELSFVASAHGVELITVEVPHEPVSA